LNTTNFRGDYRDTRLGRLV